MHAWLARTFASLANRPFRVLWIGTFLSFLGFSMSGAAQNVVAYELAGSNSAVGTVMFFQGLAMLFLSPMAGAFADRAPRRMLLLFCQSALGLIYLAIAVLLALGAMSIAALAVAAFCVGTVFALIRPARSAMIGDLVEAPRRGNAVAVTELGVNATRVGGPFFAAMLLAWNPVGQAGTYFVIFAIFVVVVATLARLPSVTPVAQHNPRGFLGEVAGGMRYVWVNPRLRWVIAGLLGVTMMGWPYLVVLPAFTSEVLGRGTPTYGILLAFASIGGLAASLLIANIAANPAAPRYLLGAAVCFSVGLLILGAAPGVTVAIIGIFIAGAGANGFLALNNALAFDVAEPAYYGRVIAFNMMALSANGLVGLPLGAFADAFGERAALLVLAAAVLSCAGLLGLWLLRLPLLASPDEPNVPAGPA